MAEDTPRKALMAALEADLIGPFELERWDKEEILRLPPSRWYLTGFLAPEEGRENEDEDSDPTDGEGLGVGDDESEEEGSGAEPETKRRNILPASMGMSVLLQPGSDDTVRATVRFAEYVRESQEAEGHERPVNVWRRVARQPVEVELPLDANVLAGDGVLLPDTVGIRLVGQLQTLPETSRLPTGTRALSLFLVNRRAPGDKGRRDEQYIFQVSFELEHEAGFLARPNVADEQRHDWDERVADLQFRERCEYAVGHGVSVEIPKGQEVVQRVRTTWLPTAEVKRVKTHEEDGVETSMEALSNLASAGHVRSRLAGLPKAYGTWIDKQKAIPLDSDRRLEMRMELLQRANRARERIERGIELLCEDDTVRQAFELANQAMAQAARQRRPDQEPRWRLFQLAFVLLNLEGVANEGSPDREDVELIFFPTGGGKTEAYLGVIAFTLLLRRLRGRERPDQGLGVAVILRYTLRLLTLDQLGRAATLICALELERRKQPELLGDVRFSVGLWVGQSATPNYLSAAAKEVTAYKNGSGPNPCPVTHCPWCLGELKPAGLMPLPNVKTPESIRVACVEEACPFTAAADPDGLPIVFVDEQVYREVPSFIVATVDKFAMMPWRGETGMLFGRATSRAGRRFFGPTDSGAPKDAELLPHGLRPPELIVQDELHLISGPLGTMVGLYETAVEALSVHRDADGKAVRPKVLAATATVRRAAAQIQALFGRDGGRVNVFPPPAVNDSETFFAEVDGGAPGRLYLGVAAQGRAMRRILSRVYTVLLGAAMKGYDPDGDPEQTADAYMTVAGYFNSLRELGGMRRLVEDEVRARLDHIEDRRPLGFAGEHPWFENRIIGIEPVELTSRERTEAVARSKARLSRPYADQADRVDVLLASNMISVGVDIDRLGLMVVAGQPKTTAEYIQASSRVGRQAKWPGLVVTCFNLHKPRDRSHYERFSAYHESFYRFVEATSVTPFSGPALDRGLAGTLVAMTRLSDPALTPAAGVMGLPSHAVVGDEALADIVERAGRHLVGSDSSANQRLKHKLEARGKDLLDAWKTIVDVSGDAPAKRGYSPFDRDKTAGKALLYQVLDAEAPPEGTPDHKFAAPTSMRDVEATTHLWVVGRKLGRKS